MLVQATPTDWLVDVHYRLRMGNEGSLEALIRTNIQSGMLNPSRLDMAPVGKPLTVCNVGKAGELSCCARLFAAASV